MQLFRAHSFKDLTKPNGIINNPYINTPRNPRHSDPALHAIWGSWFQETFSLDYRSKTIFCTGNQEVASSYTNSKTGLICIEPLGDFTLCFSNKCKDLYGHFLYSGISPPYQIDKVYEVMNSLEYIEFKNEGLPEAALSGNEIMVYANQFRYMVIKK